MGTRAFSAAAAALSSLLLAGAAGATTIFADGSSLGASSGAGTNWSSDLGVDYFHGVFPDSPNIGSGATTPLRPQGSLFSKESVTNSVGPVVNFGGSTGVLGATATLDVALGGAGAVVDGKVNHVHFDESVPSIGGYGMFVNSTMVADTFFYGGIPQTPTFVYWAYQWAMSTELPADSHLTADYLIDIGGNTNGGRIEANGVAPGNFGGSAFGVFQLRGGDTGGTINLGYGLESSVFSFAPQTGPAAARRPAAARPSTPGTSSRPRPSTT
jgi:hypothetical protein